jgi:hypothetical protein
MSGREDDAKLRPVQRLAVAGFLTGGSTRAKERAPRESWAPFADNIRYKNSSHRRDDIAGIIVIGDRLSREDGLGHWRCHGR